MARKNLLTESELRRFMKLAEMRPIGEEKIQEMYGGMPGARDDEEELDEEEMEMDMDMGAEEAPVDELPMDDEPAMDDEPEMGAAPEGDMELSDDEAQAIIDLADKLRAAMGGEEGEAEMEMGAEDDLEAPEGGDSLEMDAEEEPMMEGEDDDEEEDQRAARKQRKDREDHQRKIREGDDEDIVAEVARRVAERLQAESKKEEIVDQLAERIMKRLTK